MLKSIPRTNTIDPLSANEPREQSIESARKSSAGTSLPEKQTAKKRFLEKLGLPVLPTQHGLKAAPLRRPTVALLPSIVAPAIAETPQPLADELTMLKNSIRNQIQTLPAVEAARYQRFLNHAPLCNDPVRQILLLNLLGASITTAIKRLEIEPGSNSKQPSMWDQLSRTSASLQFQKSVSGLPGFGESDSADESNAQKRNDK